MEQREGAGCAGEGQRGYVNESGIGKKGSCHLFRHSMATLMLEGGADVRYVQEMLGHTKPETTQIYTQVSIGKLREVYLRTHPAAKLGKSVRNGVSHGAGAEAEDLLVALADEAAEEDAAVANRAQET